MIDIHELRSTEKNAFIDLWSETFGDSREDIIEFCENFGDDLKSFVLVDSEIGYDVLSSLTLFKMGKLFVPGIEESFDTYISYAICTDKKARGRGYGAAITNFASDYVGKMNLNYSSNMSLSALSPASESLIDFYKPLGYDNFFFSEYKSLDVNRESAEKINLSVISPEEYNKKREQLLEGTVHITLSEKSLKYLSGYNKFISFNNNLGNLKGISTCSELSKDGELRISELLLYGNGENLAVKPIFEYEKAANAISLSLGASRLDYRFPSKSPNSIVQGMLYDRGSLPFADINPSHDSMPYLGFPFD